MRSAICTTLPERTGFNARDSHGGFAPLDRAFHVKACEARRAQSARACTRHAAE